MLRGFLALFILIHSVEACSQNFPFRRNRIMLSLPRLIDVVNPGIELNYERSTSKRYSTEITAAYLAPVFHGPDFQGFRVGLEEKRFVDIEEPRVYLSVQAVYNNSALRHVNNYGYDTATNTYINNPFTIEKQTTALNLKWGLEFALGRFIIGQDGGIGIKYRQVHHEGRKFPFQRPRGFDPYFNSRNEGNSWTINLPASLKIGYSF